MSQSGSRAHSIGGIITLSASFTVGVYGIRNEGPIWFLVLTIAAFIVGVWLTLPISAQPDSGKQISAGESRENRRAQENQPHASVTSSPNTPQRSTPRPQVSAPSRPDTPRGTPPQPYVPLPSRSNARRRKVPQPYVPLASRPSASQRSTPRQQPRDSNATSWVAYIAIAIFLLSVFLIYRAWSDHQERAALLAEPTSQICNIVPLDNVSDKNPPVRSTVATILDGDKKCNQIGLWRGASLLSQVKLPQQVVDEWAYQVIGRKDSDTRYVFAGNQALYGLRIDNSTDLKLDWTLEVSHLNASVYDSGSASCTAIVDRGCEVTARGTGSAIFVPSQLADKVIIPEPVGRGTIHDVLEFARIDGTSGQITGYVSCGRRMTQLGGGGGDLYRTRFLTKTQVGLPGFFCLPPKGSLDPSESFDIDSDGNLKP